MHADEFPIDVPLVRRLLAAQFPQWARLPIEPVDSDGTDNAIYRLGEGMAVRLPRTPGRAGGVEKEHRWLPMLAPQLSFAVPVSLAKGAPAESYPCPWSVCPWLPGESAAAAEVVDLGRFATELAQFIA